MEIFHGKPGTYQSIHHHSPRYFPVGRIIKIKDRVVYIDFPMEGPVINKTCDDLGYLGGQMSEENTNRRKKERRKEDDRRKRNVTPEKERRKQGRRQIENRRGQK